MAERRMFTKKIVDSDAFLDMPLSTQALYFHLNMRADDDGFVNSAKKIQRMIGASEDDLKLLIAKRFILAFANGVIVIKHWRMHNLLRKDRYNPTQYQEEFEMLGLKDNGSYTESTAIPMIPEPANHVATTWQPNGNHLATQYSIGKDSIGKVSIDEYNMCDPDESHEKKPSKSEIDRFFEGLWSIYPVKKGKGQVSDSKRKALYEIGEAEMHRAVHRYLTELKKDASWRKPQNGSTFFNSGYVDYLDKNFEPQAVQQHQQNKTAAMLDESYDMMDAWAKATEGMS